MTEAAAPNRRHPRPLPTFGYAFMVVFLFGVSGAKVLTNEENQMFWLFHTGIFVEYLAYHAAAALLLGTLYLGASRVANDRAWLVVNRFVVGWIIANIAMIVAFKGVNRIVGSYSLLEILPMPDLVVMAAAVPFVFLPRLALHAGRLLRLGAKLFAPLPLVLLVGLARAPQYRVEYQDPPPAPPSPARPAPVLMLVMDALDRARTTDDPAMMRRFANLEALASHATVFTDSRTPGLRTHLSMPAILYQDRDVKMTGPNQYALVRDGQNLPLRQIPSWYELVGREGDFKVMLGFHIDYHAIVGDRVDWLRSPGDRYVPLAESFLGNMRSHAYILTTASWVPLLSTSDYTRQFYDDRWALLVQDVQASCMTALRMYGPSLVGVFHMVLPHPPFVFNADGRRPTPDLPDDELYAQNLEFADRLLGELFDELRRQELWDAATIIVTGDHGFPWAVQGRQPPLIIKLPGQIQGRIVAEESWTCDIAAWLHRQPEFTALRPPRE